MKTPKLIILTLTPIILGLLLGALGLLLGSLYGGNFGCFEYQGLQGYESCGLFFAQLGLALGIVGGLTISVHYYKK